MERPGHWPGLGMDAEKKLEKMSCRKWSCKISSDFVWENDGPGLPEKTKVPLSLSFHVWHGHKVVCH